MSEENVTKVTDTANAEPTNQAKTETVETNVEAKESVNDRLLRESKEWKKKAQELEKRVKESEELKLKETQNYKALYERVQKERDTLATKMLEDKKKTAALQAAQKYRVKDFDDALKLGNQELLQYDKDQESYVGFDTFFEDLKTRKPWMFEMDKVPPPAPMRAGGQPKEVNIKDMPLNEKEKFLKQQLREMFSK